VGWIWPLREPLRNFLICLDLVFDVGESSTAFGREHDGHRDTGPSLPLSVDESLSLGSVQRVELPEILPFYPIENCIECGSA
jgi:hypothetical protein